MICIENSFQMSGIRYNVQQGMGTSGRTKASARQISCRSLGFAVPGSWLIPIGPWSQVPSGNLLHSYWKWPVEIDCLPIEHGDFQ